MPRKLVYVASLSHSGSTLLDLMLGAHPSLMGLGEIALTVNEDPRDVANPRHVDCSCGSSLLDCSFWGATVARLDKLADADFVDRYTAVLDEFEKSFGSSHILVDSSKYLPALQQLHGRIDADFRVLHLIKDVRNYTISQITKRPGSAGRSARRHFRAWYRENREIIDYLEGHGIPFMSVGYEEICLQPDMVIPKICDFLGVDVDFSMLDIKNSKSHIVRGNRMRYQPEKRQALRYDHRWFCRDEWRLPSLLYPRIMRFNATRVYSNETARPWGA